MKSRRSGRKLRLLLAGLFVAVGTLGALVPVAEASCTAVGALWRCTAATATDKSPEKRIVVFCPVGHVATGGGAQVFATQFKDKPEPGQQGRLNVTQVVPMQNLTGYAARAQAQNGFKYPWHLTAYAVCQ